jgi:CBS domain containing-hemolysin-like protein
VDETIFDAAKGDSSTLAGFLMEILGRVPHKGEKHTFHDCTFTVEAGNHRKLDRIKVQKQL